MKIRALIESVEIALIEIEYACADATAAKAIEDADGRKFLERKIRAASVALQVALSALESGEGEGGQEIERREGLIRMAV